MKFDYTNSKNLALYDQDDNEVLGCVSYDSKTEMAMIAYKSDGTSFFDGTNKIAFGRPVFKTVHLPNSYMAPKRRIP